MLGVSVASSRRAAAGVQVKNAMVRVTTPSATGAGFLIEGPGSYVYVATANHVVDRGERVLVERDVGADKHAFVEAFPETEIVAIGPRCGSRDHPDQERRCRAVLAAAAREGADEGCPHPVVRLPGLEPREARGPGVQGRQDLSLVSFPAYDERYARIVARTRSMVF